MNDIQAAAHKPELAPLTDAYVHHDWNSIHEVLPYLGREWHELLLRKDDMMGPADPRISLSYRNPFGEVTPDPGGRRRPASDAASLLREITRHGAVGRVVLGFDEAAHIGAIGSHHQARAMVAALNDWTIAEWLTVDPRLYAVAVIPGQVPEDAAKEIRRVGANQRVVAVALGANTLGRPFGHEVYHPIYEAASELDLPLVLQVGSDAVPGQSTPPIGGGSVETVGEFRAMSNHSHMSHVMSLIFRGAFSRFPNLRVLLVGGGAAWVPGYLWRLDYWYRQSQFEVPWVKELPSRYFIDRCRAGTYSMEKPAQPERLVAALSTVPEMGDLLIYTSCYPKADSEPAPSIAARLPEAWRRRVLHQNADSFFRWPGRPAPATITGVTAASRGGE